MDIADFLTMERIALDLRSRDKGALLAEAARLGARGAAAIDPVLVAAELLAREQLGSTGLGQGFALPHARIAGLGRYVGIFVRLARPIPFDAIDAKPVDLVFSLLIPSETITHVSALAAISRRFRDPALAAQLRRAETPARAYGILTSA